MRPTRGGVARSSGPTLGRESETALQLGIAGIGFRQPLSDGEARLDFSALVRLPCAFSTRPIFSYDTDKSSCNMALPGSDFASWSAISRLAS
jgi:hypothetical protein